MTPELERLRQKIVGEYSAYKYDEWLEKSIDQYARAYAAAMLEDCLQLNHWCPSCDYDVQIAEDLKRQIKERAEKWVK